MTERKQYKGKNIMTEKESKYIQSCMLKEGMEYCFSQYSEFQEIDDPEFHKLRKYFVNVVKGLRDYVESRGKEI